EPAEVRDDRGDGALDLGQVEHVHLDRQRAPAHRLDASGETPAAEIEATGSARRPTAAISAAALSPDASWRPRAMSAPAFARASEIARPSPRDAPVTSATRPPRSNRG